MVSCPEHALFFDHNCELCKKEYFTLKGLEQKNSDISSINIKNKNSHKYKEFTEDRAKKLYEKLLVYYLRNNNELDASLKAKSVIRKQCKIRNIIPWTWL